MNLEDPVKSVQRVLEMERVASQVMLPGAFMQDCAKVGAFPEYTMDRLIVCLTSFVLTEQLVNEIQEVKLSVPSSWWQHFKRDHMPTWFKYRWPIKLTTMSCQVQFRAKGTYPEANIALPPDKFGRRILFETFEQEPWRPDESPE